MIVARASERTRTHAVKYGQANCNSGHSFADINWSALEFSANSKTSSSGPIFHWISLQNDQTWLSLDGFASG
jgi:hypothetical protein